MKSVVEIRRNANVHWVGDGFPVRSIFSPGDADPRLSPFLLLDFAGPASFPPTDKPRGVDEHPHRGFETVTIVYQGKVEHRDSGGNRGTVGPGDVQWMTAGSGVVHEEKHEREFAREGGTLEMIQLWVNLPKAEKMTAPRYQTLFSADIPAVELAGNAGQARVIAGELQGHRGPASTFSPVEVYDLQLKAGGGVELAIPEGHNASLLVRKGSLSLDEDQALTSGELAIFDTTGDRIAFRVNEDTTALLLAGRPIPDPVVSYGPFVMNTQAEVQQALTDYRAGRMGHLV